MAREFEIVSNINVLATVGLCPPPTAPTTPWCYWVEDGTRKLPDVIRFCWQPQDGRLYAGTQFRHVMQIPKGDPYPFQSYLRGFSFPRMRIVALRTYYWPSETYDFFDQSHADLHDRVADAFLLALKPLLPKRALVYRSVDNRFLRQRFSSIALDW